MDAHIVGDRIAKLRKSHNMTQKQLADELSVTYKAVSKWETGAGLPDIAMLPTLASVLGVSIDEIVSGTSNDDNIDNHNNPDRRTKTIRRFIRKPIVIITFSLIIAFVAFVIIYSNLKTNENLGYDEGIPVHLDKASGFGVSGDRAKEIYDIQRAEELRTQLLKLNHIEYALVVVNTMDGSPFRIQENESEATVSVLLTIADNHTLSDNEVESIKNLVWAAVPGIKYENISITDSDLNYYPSSIRD